MDASLLYRAVGAEIRRRRRALDLTQAKLANRLGMSRGALANIETGRQQLLLHQLFRFAAALGMNAHDLLRFPKEMNIEHFMPTAAKRDFTPSKKLPMPKGLTADQRIQVARVLSARVIRNTKNKED